MKEIFVCCRFSFERDLCAPEYVAARSLTERLRGMGYRVYFSLEETPDSGTYDYLTLISRHLDGAECLILVSGAPGDCADGWVRYEWESFYRDVADGKKKLFLSYLGGDPAAYPRGIRMSPSFRWGEEGLGGLVEAVEAFPV